MFFGFAMEITNFGGNCQWKTLRFIASIFFIKALRQVLQIREAMSDETLITAKNLSNEAMKHLTLAKKLKR